MQILIEQILVFMNNIIIKGQLTKGANHDYQAFIRIESAFHQCLPTKITAKVAGP